MLSERMQAALNEQITKEFYSAYLYLSMAAYFDDKGLKGFANWMRVQHREEEIHALMIFGYINEAGGRVKLAAIDGPDVEFVSPAAVFEQALEHEQMVSASIHALADLAIEDHDHATLAFLQWFINEQVEEEASAREKCDTLKLAGDSGSSLLMLDRELGQRTFAAPAEAAAYGVI